MARLVSGRAPKVPVLRPRVPPALRLRVLTLRTLHAQDGLRMVSLISGLAGVGVDLEGVDAGVELGRSSSRSRPG